MSQHGLEEWLTAAQTESPEDLRDHILAGCKQGKPFTPYVPTVPMPGAPYARVLDFGCGVGRNFPFLNSIAKEVTGFDLPPMIARCQTLASEPVAHLTSDWDALRSQRFDLIYASLVLQHIEPEACRAYLRDFAQMAPVVYLLSRADTDFGERVWDVVSAIGSFALDGPCVQVEHDPATHQLRVTGPTELASLTSGHFECILRSSQASLP